MNIVILTGAGVSAESGLGTFRDRDGLWSKYDLSQVATPQGFARDPARVHEFYNARRANARTARPNPAHLALTRLQDSNAAHVVIVTQNVDDLHERAGSTALHMHGRLDRARCDICGSGWAAPLVMHPEDTCPQCNLTATRPDIVWFGEVPMHMEQIATHLAEADLFVAIGTSGQVYPAAGFVAEAADHGAQTLELNLERSEISDAFDTVRLGAAGQIVPQWVDSLLGGTI